MKLHLFGLLATLLQAYGARKKLHCSGNGYLSDDGICNCYNGFTSGICDEKICPVGRQWHGYLLSSGAVEAIDECSNNGLCDRKTGSCVCKAGFSGSACDTLTCPVNANNEICNGHGKCINQEEASLTWDGVYLHTSGLVSDPLHAIEGCICDEPYSGYDCSLRQCPYGDDPRTTTTSDGSDEANEIQRVYCRASEGYFRLTHNRETSNPIPYDASPDSVERILEMMTGTDVDVSNTNNEAICTSTGTTSTIEFAQNSGRLPATRVSGDIPSEYGMSSLSLGGSAAPFSALSDSFILMLTRLTVTCPSSCFPSSSSSSSGGTTTVVTTTCSGGISIVFNGDMSPVIDIGSDEDDIEDAFRELNSFHLISSETSLWNAEYADSVVIAVESSGSAGLLCSYTHGSASAVTTTIDLGAPHGNIQTRGELDGFAMINGVTLSVSTAVTTNSVTTTTVVQSTVDMEFTTPYGSHDVTICGNGGTCNSVTGTCNCYEKKKFSKVESFDDGTTLPESSSVFGYWYKFESSDGMGSSGDVGDCGYEAVSTSYCPASCSQHGTCSNSTHLCDCSDGYYGGDCSQKTCPMGIPWFSEPRGMYNTHFPSPITDLDVVYRQHNPKFLPSLSECSNMGICDASSGNCQCRDGFTGSACQRLDCPRVGNYSCSGHGQCLSLRETTKLTNGTLTTLILDSLTYAQSSTSPLIGDSLLASLSNTFDFQYGNDVAEETHTSYWKSDRVYGCVCDLRNDDVLPSGPVTAHMIGSESDNPQLSGYYGYDCSLRKCPVGPYPETAVTNEKQSVTCTGSGYIAFRGHASGTQVSTSTTASELEDILEDLVTIGKVSVSGSACSSGLIVTFESEFGDLPLLTISTGNIVIAQTQQGVAELAECSGAGKCDASTGRCKCNDGFASSDGTGNIGSIGDCGVRTLDIYAKAKLK